MRWDIAWKYTFTLRVWSTFSHANVLLKCSIYGMRVQSFNSGRRRYNQSVFGFHMTNSNVLPQLYWGRFELKWLTVIQFYLNPDLWLCLMVSVDFHLNFVLRCFNIYNVWIHIFTWFKGVNGETQKVRMTAWYHTCGFDFAWCLHFMKNTILNYCYLFATFETMYTFKCKSF